MPFIENWHEYAEANGMQVVRVNGDEVVSDNRHYTVEWIWDSQVQAWIPILHRAECPETKS